MSAITEPARAKVNLTLKVHGRRADGYHEIESLVVFAADLSDVVRLTPGEGRAVSVEGPFASCITGDNLVESALARLADAAPRLVLGDVLLKKRLPIAAGIGGGSADAAALLRAVRCANPALADVIDWEGIAAALGSDVPVCFADRAAFVWGAGERLVALPPLPRLYAVLANPMAVVPLGKTARVFARLSLPPIDATDAEPQLPGRFADAAALTAYMHAHGNDLMAAATEIVPEIADVIVALAASPRCQFAGLSGAGPTCYGIYPTLDDAEAAARGLRSASPRWWVAATLLEG